jgi:hypothetical protein
VKPSSSMAPTSQQSPSRPTSTAPNIKADKDGAKSPLRGEELLGMREADQGSSSTSPDAIRGGPTHANMAFNLESHNGMNPTLRGPPANPNHGFMPHPFFSGMNMNVPSQQAFGPAPTMQYFPASFNPNAYPQAASTTRPSASMQKYPAMDPKFMSGQNQMVHPNSSPQLQNNMARRSSNYFVAPSMSPVQSSYAPRTWMPNSGPMLGPPMQMQTNASSSLQSPAMYQPAMLAANANAGILTPPGPMPAAYNSGFPPTTVSTSYGFPTPPEQGGPVVAADIPPPVPSVYPDPAYNSINNCIYNPKGTTNVYIRGLRPETTDEDLLHMVRPYGVISSTKAIIDTSTKSCKGFGFVKFEIIEQGVACIMALSQVGYQCSFAKESFSNRLKDLSEPSNTNLYISNLPLDVDEQRLDDMLKPHRVHSSRILRDQSRASRGVGFARMTDRESADAVIEQWNGKCYPGSDVPLQVRFADTPMQKSSSLFNLV